MPFWRSQPHRHEEAKVMGIKAARQAIKPWASLRETGDLFDREMPLMTKAALPENAAFAID
jgi:hypothetical protein